MTFVTFLIHVMRGLKGYLTLLILNMCAYVATILLLAKTLKDLITTAQQGGDIWPHVVIIIAIELINLALWSFFHWIATTYEPLLEVHIEQEAFLLTLKQPYAFFQATSPGHITTTLRRLSILIPSIMHTLVNFFLYTALLFCSYQILLWSIHPLIGILFLAWICLLVLFTWSNYAQLRAYSTIISAYEASIIERVADTLTNILSVRLSNAQQREYNGLKQMHNTIGVQKNKRRLYIAQKNIIAGYGFSFYYALSTSLLLWLCYQNILTAGDVTLVIAANTTVTEKLWRAGEKIRELEAHWSEGSCIVATMLNPQTPRRLPVPHDLPARNGTICFNKVTFGYTPTIPVLKELSVTIPAGQKVGLIGPSGSGKTTFAQLLLRLYDIAPGCGSITISEHDIATVSLASLRNHIAVVPQDTPVFLRSIKENIAYAAPHTSDKDIRHAALYAAADTFIEQLPSAYNTIIDHEHTGLSGGQYQRLLLARALLKKEAHVLILDEATSQLDGLTEQSIQATFTQWLSEKPKDLQPTLLVVAHRLTTIQHMDRILIFDNGTIVGDGTHEELLQRNTLYQALWKAQAEEC